MHAGTFTNDSKVAEILGIPTLKQETSLSVSVGAVAKIAKGFDLKVNAYQNDIKNRIILSNTFNGGNNAALTNELNAAGAGTASIFTNGVDTRSRGLEAVLTHTTKFAHNQSITTSAAHVSLQNKITRDANGNIIIHASTVLEASGQLSKYFNRADQSRIETYSPKTKDIVSFQYKIGKAGALLRVSYFGKVSALADSRGGANLAANAFDGCTVETIGQAFSGKGITDLSFSYAILKNVTVNIGATNLFNVYPDEQTHYNNTSSGRFTYSRAVSQFGYNGRYIFGKVAINL